MLQNLLQHAQPCCTEPIIHYADYATLCWAADSWLESQWAAPDQTGSTQEAGTPPSDDGDPTQQETQQAASELASSRHMYTKLAQHAKRAGNRASRLGRAAAADGSRVGAAVWQEARRLQGAAEADFARCCSWVQVSLCVLAGSQRWLSHDLCGASQSCCSAVAPFRAAHAHVHMQSPTAVATNCLGSRAASLLRRLAKPKADKPHCWPICRKWHVAHSRLLEGG